MVPSTAPSTLADHPCLTPCFHLTIRIGSALPIGSLSRGTPLTVVPLVSGTFNSVEGYEPRVEAFLSGTGTDYVHNDPDGGRMRLKSDLVVLDLEGEAIQISYTGIIDVTNEMRRILGRSSNAKSTEFGTSLIQLTFETGSLRYKSLEQGVFVGSGRFVIEERSLSVEYRISQVGRGPGAPAESSETGEDAAGGEAKTPAQASQAPEGEA